MNLPNILTLSRLALIPVFMYAVLADNFSPRWIAAIAFGLAALTDWFDGFVARKLNQVTEFGKLADPIIDRIFIAAAVLTLYIKISAAVPLWAVIIVVGRDIAMVIGWVYVSRSGKRIQVAYSGKVATAVLMSAFFVLFSSIQVDLPVLKTAGVWTFYVGMVLSLVSGFNYLKLGKNILQSNQAAR